MFVKVIASHGCELFWDTVYKEEEQLLLLAQNCDSTVLC